MQPRRDAEREGSHLPSCHCQGEIGASTEECPTANVTNRWTTRWCPKIAPICLSLAMCLSLKCSLHRITSRDSARQLFLHVMFLFIGGEIIQSENRKQTWWLRCLITQTELHVSNSQRSTCCEQFAKIDIRMGGEMVKSDEQVVWPAFRVLHWNDLSPSQKKQTFQGTH